MIPLGLPRAWRKSTYSGNGGECVEVTVDSQPQDGLMATQGTRDARV